MQTINRTIITIIPKKPYVDWANSFDDDGPKLYADTLHAISLLIPENYDEYNYELFMKRNYKKIFDAELSSWMEDPDVWPKNRDYNKFKRWFEIIPSDTVFELGEGPIVIEDY